MFQKSAFASNKLNKDKRLPWVKFQKYVHHLGNNSDFMFSTFACSFVCVLFR